MVFLQRGFRVALIKSSGGLWDPYLPYPRCPWEKWSGQRCLNLVWGQDLMAMGKWKVFQNDSPVGLWKTPALSSSCLGCEQSRGSWACLYPGFRFLLLLELWAKFLTKHSNRGGIKKPQIIQSGLRFVCQHSGVALVRKRRKKLVLKLRNFNSWAVFLVSFSPDFGCWTRNPFGSLGFVSASCLPDFFFCGEFVFLPQSCCNLDPTMLMKLQL